MSHLSTAIKDIESTSKRLAIERKRDFKTLQHDTLSAVNSLSLGPGSDQARMQECFRNHRQSPDIDAGAAAAVTAGLESLAAAVANLTEKGKATSQEQRFLES